MVSVKMADENAAKQTTKKIYRKGWSTEEDTELLTLVDKFGTNRKWPTIARNMSTERTGKQCWERYHNHLKPEINKVKWTDDEDQLIIEFKESIGNKWSHISKYLPGRSDNDVKNRWNFLQRNKMTDGRVSQSAMSKCQASVSLSDHQFSPHISDIATSELDRPVKPEVCNSSYDTSDLMGGAMSESSQLWEEERKRFIANGLDVVDMDQKKKRRIEEENEFCPWLDAISVRSSSPSFLVDLDTEGYESDSNKSKMSSTGKSQSQKAVNAAPLYHKYPSDLPCMENPIFHQKTFAHADYTSSTFVPYISMQPVPTNRTTNDGEILGHYRDRDYSASNADHAVVPAPTGGVSLAMQRDSLEHDSGGGSSGTLSSFRDPFVQAINALKKRRRLSTPDMSPRITPRS